MIGLINRGDLFNSSEEADIITKTKAQKMVRVILSPWRILKGIDLSHQGGLNITGAAIYFLIQSLEKYERGFLFSKTPVVNPSKSLEEEATKYIDWTSIK